MSCTQTIALGCCDDSVVAAAYGICLNPFWGLPKYFSGNEEEVYQMLIRARVAICRLPFPQSPDACDFYYWDYGNDAPQFIEQRGVADSDSNINLFNTNQDLNGPVWIGYAQVTTRFDFGRVDGEYRWTFGRVRLTGDIYKPPGTPVVVGIEFQQSTWFSATEETIKYLPEDARYVEAHYRPPSGAGGFLLELAPANPVSVRVGLRNHFGWIAPDAGA